MYVIAIFHLVFVFHIFTCWWYMSLFKKFMHLITDLIVFVVLLFPIYQHKFASEEKASSFIINFFGASILICVILCFIALLVKFGLWLFERFKEKNPTLPKEKPAFNADNVVVNTANKLS